MNVSSKYTWALGVFLLVVATSSLAGASSEPPPECWPQASFGAEGLLPSPRRVPKNSRIIPFVFSDAPGAAVGLAPLQLRSVGPALPALGPWQLAISKVTPPNERTAYSVAEALLPEGVTEGNYALTFVPHCSSGVPSKPYEVEREFAIVEASAAPTSLGELSAIEAPSIDANPATATPSFGFPDRRFDVTLKATPELFAFRYLSYLHIALGPATRIRQEDVNEAEAAPYGRYDLGLSIRADQTLHARVGGNCRATGPIQLRVTGGVYGMGDLSPVEVALGECTEADVAATGRYDRNDRPPVIVKPQGCATAPRRTEEASCMAVLSACALGLVATRRRRTKRTLR